MVGVLDHPVVDGLDEKHVLCGQEVASMERRRQGHGQIGHRRRGYHQLDL